MKRNLLFHLYPKRGSIWPWHIAQLLKHRDAWNGRRIVTVAVDGSTDAPEKVLPSLAPLGAELFWVNNHPLGETKHFVDKLRLLASEDEDEATFYAHAKGVTHSGMMLEAVRKWCLAMYTLNLGSVQAVERALSVHGAAGCFRHFLKHAGSRWCYGGTFFWVKHSALFSRRWTEIEPSRHGVEGYPGRHLRWGEMAAFTPDDVGPAWLYGGGVTDEHIERWKAYWGAPMHGSVIAYLKSRVKPEEVRGRDVLEVGSYDVNGSPRTVFSKLKPKSYLGVDQEAGPGVDRVMKAGNLVEQLGKERFDLVVSTEMLEHARDWRTAVDNMKAVVRPGGILIVTTRGPGFPFHGYPEDNWRFTHIDFGKIFADMEILDLSPDPEAPGIFIKARKPYSFVAVDLRTIDIAPAPLPPAKRAKSKPSPKKAPSASPPGNNFIAIVPNKPAAHARPQASVQGSPCRTSGPAFRQNPLQQGQVQQVSRQAPVHQAPEPVTYPSYEAAVLPDLIPARTPIPSSPPKRVERRIVVPGRVLDLKGLCDDLRDQGFEIINIGASDKETFVFLGGDESKDPAKVVASWVGRPRAARTRRV